jgi:hypothetical protein
MPSNDLGSGQGEPPWFAKVLVTAVLTALISTVISTYVTYEVWVHQQETLQAWSSRPVVDVDLYGFNGHKDLVIQNSGTIPIDDVRVYVTTYKLASEPIDSGHHQRWTGIDSFSKPGGGGPLRQFTQIAPFGGTERIDLLTAFSGLTPMYKYPSSDDITLMSTFYAYRITFRNHVTRQRFVAYVFTTPYSNFNANPFSNSESQSMGGGYGSFEHLVELRKLLKQAQLDLFDDSASDLYQR